MEVELWHRKIYKGMELLNAKAMWPSFPGSAETEESEGIIIDLALM